MSHMPYMRFYVADYLSDTMHLSTEEHGAYMLLIMAYWQTGKPIPGNRVESIIRVSNERSTDVQQTLSEFFTINEQGAWVHGRIELELAAVRERSALAASAGKASGKVRRTQVADKTRETSTNERSTDVEQMLNGRSTDVERNANDPDPDPDLRSSPRLLGLNTLGVAGINRASIEPPTIQL